ncbi:MAG: Gfo/Idh/MocA family oxidoreductase [Pirellulaceae bacterium]|nr:Gfo/Idh/MocA family oxidoreductase [Pirellulaceae bacterium]
MSRSQLGTAIVGTGFMGGVHAESLRRIGVPVVGILGSTPGKGRQAADRLGIRQSYSRFEDMLTDCDVKSVHIVTPNRLHHEMVVAAITAGKHVMCEKPLAMNVSESAELVELAAANPQLATAVNYNLRFYPLCIEARERFHQGELGELFHVTGSYVQDWLLRNTDYNWRVLADEAGDLRAIADIGTHWLDLIYSITSAEIDSVCADLQTVHPARFRPAAEVETFAKAEDANAEQVAITTDDYGSVLLRFRGGARATFFVSQVSAGRKNCLRFEIAGSARSVAWNSELPNQLWIGHRDQANELLSRDPALLGPVARLAASYPGGHNEGYADSFKHCFEAFYTAIEGRATNDATRYPTFIDGDREVRVCEAILKSHQTQKWIKVQGE